MTDDEIQKIADYFRENIKEIKPLGDGYFFNHLSLCVIDAVWSLGVRYKGVQNVVNRYCNQRKLEPYREKALRENSIYPEKSKQESISDFLEYLNQFTSEKLADDIFKNHQRTSSKNGILKAEAIVQFAEVLSNHNVNYFQDINDTKLADNKEFEREIKAISGQTYGTSLDYFFMLCGDENRIKNDRQIQRFLAEPIRRNQSISNEEALDAFQRILKVLNDERIQSVRHLDNIVWEYQSKKEKIEKKKDEIITVLKEYIDKMLTESIVEEISQKLAIILANKTLKKKGKFSKTSCEKRNKEEKYLAGEESYYEKYWEKLLLKMKEKKTGLFENVNAKPRDFIGNGARTTGLYYILKATKEYASIGLWISKDNHKNKEQNAKGRNKEIYDELLKYKNVIEEKFGNNLLWERMDDKDKSQITYKLEKVNISDEKYWEEMMDFQINNIIKFEKAIREPLEEVKQKLR